MGNRLQQTTVGQGAGTIGHTYDTRDRLLTENANSLTYDGNGNLTEKVGETTYVWDHENRLIRVTKADGTVLETDYDADGNRVQTTVTPPTGPPTVTNYLVDMSGALSHVVAETDGTGALVAHYVRGDDLLAVMRPDGAGGWTSSFFHADGVGSIRRLTGEAGTITDGYTYSAFGELLAHTGSDAQPYAFTAEPLDLNSGLQYHRARWMDSRVGRFLGIDLFDGVLSRPITEHRYLYAAQNPANASDPSGLFVGLAAIGPMLSAISATAIPSYQAALGAVIGQSQKTVTVDVVQAYGSSGNAGADLDYANDKVYKQARILVNKRKEIRLDERMTRWALGNDLILEEGSGQARGPSGLTAEEVRLFGLASSSHAVPAFYVKGMPRSRGEAFGPSLVLGFVGFVVNSSNADRSVFSHELGHVLLDCDCPAAPGNLMNDLVMEGSVDLTAAQIIRMRASPYAR